MRGHRKRVLVTGGADFWLRTSAMPLIQKGYDVLCVDNFFHRPRATTSPPYRQSNFEFSRHDVTFPL